MKKIMFLLTLCLAWTVSVWAAPVTRVEVQITDSNNRTSPILLRKMEDSMRVVAEQLFNGKDETMIRGIAAEYERLLAEISERVIPVTRRMAFGSQRGRERPAARPRSVFP